MYTNFTFFFSFWGTSSPRPSTGALPLEPTGGLPSPGSLAVSPPLDPLHCKMLGTPMLRSQPLTNFCTNYSNYKFLHFKCSPLSKARDSERLPERRTWTPWPNFWEGGPDPHKAPYGYASAQPALSIFVLGPMYQRGRATLSLSLSSLV